VRPEEKYSRSFPEKVACAIEVKLQGGRVVSIEKQDYEGFHTRPASWERVQDKFEKLSGPYANPLVTKEIVGAVRNLESIPIKDLTMLLSRLG
jgi:2-methylcitrate dehydratase